MSKRILAARKGLFALLAVAGLTLAAGPTARAEEPHGFIHWCFHLFGVPQIDSDDTTAGDAAPCGADEPCGRDCHHGGCASSRTSCRGDGPCHHGTCGTGHAPCGADSPCSPNCAKGGCDNCTPPCCAECDKEHGRPCCSTGCGHGGCESCPEGTCAVRCMLRLAARQAQDAQECHADSMHVLSREQVHHLLAAVVNTVPARIEPHAAEMERVVREQQAQIQQMAQTMEMLLREMHSLHNEIKSLRNQTPVYVPMPYPYYPNSMPSYAPNGYSNGTPYYPMPSYTVPVAPAPATVPVSATTSMPVSTSNATPPVGYGLGHCISNRQGLTGNVVPNGCLPPLPTSGSVPASSGSSNAVPPASRGAAPAATDQSQIFSFYLGLFH